MKDEPNATTDFNEDAVFSEGGEYTEELIAQYAATAKDAIAAVAGVIDQFKMPMVAFFVYEANPGDGNDARQYVALNCPPLVASEIAARGVLGAIKKVAS